MSFQRRARLPSGPQSVFSLKCSWEVAEVGEKEEAGRGLDSLLYWETPTQKTCDKALYFGEYGLSCALKQAEVSRKK